MRPVLTLHGIGVFGQRGPWQNAIKRMLAPHFDCITIKYSHYRWLGFASALIEPWVAAIGVAIVLTLRLCHQIALRWPWIVLVFLISWFAAKVRQNLCVTHFLRSLRRTPFGSRPHVIAHSMGTKVVGAVLLKYPQVRLARIVFAGCVLPVDYPCHVMTSPGAARFSHLRNEVAVRDIVPRLAQVGTKLRLLTEYGYSGSSGFSNNLDIVHTMSALSPACSTCALTGTIAPVHNVSCERFGHSSVFDAESYAAFFWLPFLWGIEPMEYSDFLELCFVAEEHHEIGNWPAYMMAERRLLERQWGWAGGKRLREYIDEVARKYPSGSPSRVPAAGRIVRKVWQDVVTGCRAHQERNIGWERQALALHPIVSVLGAVEAILG